MSVDDIKNLVREVMDRDFSMVPTPSGKGDRVHLEVWEHRRTGLPVGLEMGHSTLVNLWLVRSDVPLDLPLSLRRTEKEPDGDGWTDAAGDGANHNLKHYRQFSGRPLTRVSLGGMREAEDVLSLLTRGSVRGLTTAGNGGRTGNAFVLKINGLLHAPGGICRPVAASDWEGGILSMPLQGKKISSRYDMSAGPAIETGDALYVWTHEDKSFGNGRGLTARAMAGQVSVDDETLRIELRNVQLLPHPFDFRALAGKHEGGPLLSAMDGDRRLRCWNMSEDDRAEFDKLIETFGSAMAAAKAAAEEAYLTPLERALKDQAEEIEEAEEERKTAIVKARPGQQRFREEAMRRHKNKCIMTGVSIREVLDAAHVIPHTGAPEFEVPENSLVLRRDIHALFDAHLIAIHPKSNEIVCSPSLVNTSYYKLLSGRIVDHKLAPKALHYQFQQFKLAIQTPVP